MSLLECFDIDDNWAALRKGLEAILDRKSEAYKQLENIEYDCVVPLLTAACEGYLELTKVLLSHGVLLETVNLNGSKMLHGAAFRGHLPVVKLLLRCGAKVDPRNNLARTPLMCAAWQGHVQVVTCLLWAGADKSAKCIDGSTALDYANSGDHTLVVQALTQTQY